MADRVPRWNNATTAVRTLEIERQNKNCPMCLHSIEVTKRINAIYSHILGSLSVRFPWAEK